MGPTSVPRCGGQLTLEPQISWRPSPNFGLRKAGLPPTFIVLHYTAMDTADAAINRLCDPSYEVSAHYLISQTGHVTQMVHEAYRAWHAGAGSWRGIADMNTASIGIELCNRGDAPFPQGQMDALKGLLRAVMARWAIPQENVIGHSDLAPERKCDPGRLFDWADLAQDGLAVYRGGAETALSFDQAARQFGYDEFAPDAILEAFRQRFRPEAHGPLCEADREVMAGLAATFPR